MPTLQELIARYSNEGSRQDNTVMPNGIDNTMAQVYERDKRIADIKNQRENSLLSAGVASGAPALLSMLTGGSTAVNSMLLDKGQKSAKSMADDMEVKDFEKIRNELGQPEFVNKKDSEFMTPYIEQKQTANNGGTGAHGGVMAYSNKKTGEISNFYMNKDGNIYRVGENAASGSAFDPDVINTEYTPYKGHFGGKVTDAYGDTSFVQDQKTNTGHPIKTGGAKGYGSMMGVPDKGMLQIEKYGSSYEKDSTEIDKKMSGIETSLNLLGKGKMTPEEAASVKEDLIRSIVPELRLTDSDADRAGGQEARATIEQIKNMVSKKAIGEMTKGELSDLTKSLNTLKAKLLKTKTMLYKNYTEKSSTIPGGSDYVKSKNTSMEKSIKERTAAYESIKQVATKSFGSDKKRLKMFLDSKKIELGL